MITALLAVVALAGSGSAPSPAVPPEIASQAALPSKCGHVQRKRGRCFTDQWNLLKFWELNEPMMAGFLASQLALNGLDPQACQCLERAIDKRVMGLASMSKPRARKRLGAPQGDQHYPNEVLRKLVRGCVLGAAALAVSLFGVEVLVEVAHGQLDETERDKIGTAAALGCWAGIAEAAMT